MARVAVLIGALAALSCLAAVQAGPLWDYANAPDPAFAWVDTGYRINNPQWTGYLLNLTSQTWLTPQDTDRHVWTHQLMVFVPTECKNYSMGFMYVHCAATSADAARRDPFCFLPFLTWVFVVLSYVTGGDNDNPKPPPSDGLNEGACARF